MAVTIVQTAASKSVSYTITITADGDADITLPDKAIANMAFQSDGADGGGTLTVLGSLDGTNFVALGFNTSADPRNATSVASATAAGMWTINADLLGVRKLRFHLTGSTSPTLVITFVVSLME